MKNTEKYLPETPQEEKSYEVLGPEMFGLYKKLDKVRNNGGSAKNKAIQERKICSEIAGRNQKMVGRIASQINRCFRDRAIDFEDILQEGRIGLLIGTKRFDFRRGVRYDSYVGLWVRQNIARFLMNSGGTIIRPGYMHENVRNLNKAKQSLKDGNGKDASDKKLADFLGWDLGKLMAVYDAKKLGLEMYSLDDAVFNAKENSPAFLDGIAVKDNNGEEAIVEEEIFNRQLVREVNKILDECDLSTIESDTINRRFGEEHTLQEIGDDYGLSRERIRQIESAVLRKLWKKKYLDKLCQIDRDTYSKKIVAEENSVFPEKSEEILKKFSEFLEHLKGVNLNSMSPRAILVKTAKFFGFTLRRVIGTRQNGALFQVRSIAAYILREHKRMKCGEIGRLMGYRTSNTTFAWLKNGSKLFKKYAKPRK